MPQYARPIEDAFLYIPPPEYDGGPFGDSWRDNIGGTSDLFQRIGTNIPNDTDYAESDLILGPLFPDADEDGDPGEAAFTESTAYVCKLSEVVDPVIDEGFTIRARLAKNEPDGVNVDCLIELRKDYNVEGDALESDGDLGQLIASHIFEGITSEFIEYSFVVTPEEAASIDNYDDLYLRFVFSASLKGVYA